LADSDVLSVSCSPPNVNNQDGGQCFQRSYTPESTSGQFGEQGWCHGRVGTGIKETEAWQHRSAARVEVGRPIERDPLLCSVPWYSLSVHVPGQYLSVLIITMYAVSGNFMLFWWIRWLESNFTCASVFLMWIRLVALVTILGLVA